MGVKLDRYCGSSLSLCVGILTLKCDSAFSNDSGHQNYTEQSFMEREFLQNYQNY